MMIPYIEVHTRFSCIVSIFYLFAGARTNQETSNIDVIVEAMSPLLLANSGSSFVCTNDAEL